MLQFRILNIRIFWCFEIHELILPLVILNVWTSFSHEAKEAFRTSVNFLFVPGVSGGICVGTSIYNIKKNKKIIIYKILIIYQKHQVQFNVCFVRTIIIIKSILQVINREDLDFHISKIFIFYATLFVLKERL